MSQSKIFLTSDLHFCHNKEFIWKARGYNCVADMNEGLVHRWNYIVTENDIVYFLGDFFLEHTDLGLTFLHCLHFKELYWVLGNHDTTKKVDAVINEFKNIHICGTSTLLKHHKKHLLLSHYPTLTANYDDKEFNKHVINFHGHTHQQKNFLDDSNPFMYHVGVDSHNGYPVNIDDAIADVRSRWLESQQANNG